MVNTREKVLRLRKLGQLAQQVAHEMERETPLPLSRKQLAALDDVLRTLDIRNEYKVGDRLRKAFQIELDAVKYHRKNHYYGEDD